MEELDLEAGGSQRVLLSEQRQKEKTAGKHRGSRVKERMHPGRSVTYQQLPCCEVS